MAFTDLAPNVRPVRFSLTEVFGAVVRWVAARRAARARKVALQDLMFAPDHRLRDVGITRHDLLAAIEGRRS